MDRGIIFTLDTLTEAIAISIMLIAIFGFINANITLNFEKSEEMERILFASAFSEMIIKNSDEWHGAAHYSEEKKRVELNILDEKQLGKLKPRSIGKYFIAKMYEKKANGEKYYFDQKNINDCSAIERFVIIKGILERKAIIGVVVCEK